MPITWEILNEGTGTGEGIGRSDADVYYKGYDASGLPSTDAPILAAMPVNLTDPSPLGQVRGAVCVYRKIIHREGPNVCFAVAKFDNLRWGGAPQKISQASEEKFKFLRPVWGNLTALVVGAPQVWQRFPNDYPYMRSSSVEYDHIPITGTVSDSQKATMRESIGKLYARGSTPFVYRGAQLVTSQYGTGKVIYMYETVGPVPAFTGIPGVLSSLPALGFLEQYKINPSTSPPTVTVETAADQFPAGPTLPFT